jgi:hypothetical protein
MFPGAGGSRKGRPNKRQSDIKRMVTTALNMAGSDIIGGRPYDDDGNPAGVYYLHQQARQNPAPFLTLVGKVLPLQIAGDADNPLAVSVVSFAQAAQAALAEGEVETIEATDYSVIAADVGDSDDAAVAEISDDELLVYCADGDSA